MKTKKAIMFSLVLSTIPFCFGGLLMGQALAGGPFSSITDQNSLRTPWKLSSMEKWGFQFGKLIPKVKPKDIARSWKIFKGDQVQVIAGKCQGEQGKVKDVYRKRNLVYVEGVNIAKRHVAGNENMKGSIYNIEQGIHVSNVALIDPKLKKPTKVGWKFIQEESGGLRKARISKLSGEEINRPEVVERKRVHSEFSTSPVDVHKVTFIPDLDKDPLPEGCWI